MKGLVTTIENVLHDVKLKEKKIAYDSICPVLVSLSSGVAVEKRSYLILAHIQSKVLLNLFL